MFLSDVPAAAALDDSSAFDVALKGELDRAHTHLAYAAIVKAVDACTSGRVFVDIRQLSFVDAAGLRSIISARKYALTQSRDVVLFAPGAQVRKALALTGLYEEIPVIDDRLG